MSEDQTKPSFFESARQLNNFIKAYVTAPETYLGTKMVNSMGEYKTHAPKTFQSMTNISGLIERNSENGWNKEAAQSLLLIMNSIKKNAFNELYLYRQSDARQPEVTEKFLELVQKIHILENSEFRHSSDFNFDTALKNRGLGMSDIEEMRNAVSDKNVIFFEDDHNPDHIHVDYFEGDSTFRTSQDADGNTIYISNLDGCRMNGTVDVIGYDQDTQKHFLFERHYFEDGNYATITEGFENPALSTFYPDGNFRSSSVFYADGRREEATHHYPEPDVWQSVIVKTTPASIGSDGETLSPERQVISAFQNGMLHEEGYPARITKEGGWIVNKEYFTQGERMDYAVKSKDSSDPNIDSDDMVEVMGYASEFIKGYNADPDGFVSEQIEASTGIDENFIWIDADTPTEIDTDAGTLSVYYEADKWVEIKMPPTLIQDFKTPAQDQNRDRDDVSGMTHRSF